MSQEIVRCSWAEGDEMMSRYHDEEWGTPAHEDKRHFELITLEGAQAGLSWRTVLVRRQGYADAFCGFDPALVAQYTEEQVLNLVQNPAIIRHEGKVRSTVTNARQFLGVCEQFGSFDNYIWRFVDGLPVKGNWAVASDVPASTPVAAAISKDLRAKGFTFVGPTILYAYMQAAGLVDDHLTSCFRYKGVD